MTESESQLIFKRHLLRQTLFFILLGLFAVSAFFVSLSFGSLKMPFSEIIRILFESKPSIQHDILFQVRLPRVMLAGMVGICLSLSGAILQAVMRNPLAAPNITGVSAGGGLAAMIIMILLPQYYNLLIPAAFGGGMAAAVLVYSLAWNGGASPMRLILAGIAVSSLAGAVINSLMIFYPDRVAGVVDFMAGGLSARSWKHVHMIWPYMLAGLAASFLLARQLNLLMLGDDAAAGLGLDVERYRLILLAVASLLAAAAVSVAGLLGFVGLIAPHMMRKLVGPDHKVLLPACVLFSSGLLMYCDTLGRLVREPAELPAGIIMALLGAPFFLWLLRKGMRHENQSL